MKRFLRRAGVMAMSGVALAGCKTTDPGPAPIVEMPQIRCTETPNLARAKEVAFDAKRDADPVRVTIDRSSGCLVDAESKSLYDVFGLPQAGQPIILTVKAVPSSTGIFSPRLILLDESGSLLREVDQDKFLFRGGALTALLRMREGERYLVVASDDKAVGKDVSRLSGRQNANVMSNGLMTWTVYSTSEETANLTYSYGGVVEVSAEPVPTKD